MSSPPDPRHRVSPPDDWTVLDDAAGPLQAPHARDTPGGHRDPIEEEARRQRRVVEGLFAKRRAEDAGARLVETHISFVLLAGGEAYKIKKAVRLPFVDFGTLDARRRFCEDELRLNRRLAPRLYLDVVPITGTCDSPAFGGVGPVLDGLARLIVVGSVFPRENGHGFRQGGRGLHRL